MTPTGNIASLPILSLITFLPSLGALFIIFFVKKQWEDGVRWTALVISLATFLLSLYLPLTFDAGTAEFQWVEKAVWIERFGIHYFLGVDGISLLLVLLTTFVTVICILASWTEITIKLKPYMALFLVVETGVLGVFMSLDLFLFYVFWEVVLIPMVFIIGVWGGVRRLYSAIKFFLFTFTGSLFMLLGILALFFFHGQLTGNYTFDATVLIENPVAPHIQRWIFLALFLGFAVKIPMFPLHTWLPDAHTEAPTAGSIFLAAVLLKLGTYGFLRFSLPLLPNASIFFAPLMIVLSIIAILYGAYVTIAQKDMKKLVAYSSVSHMGFVMLGLFVFNAEGLKGGLLQMINHGISTGALFLLVGMIYERTHQRMIEDYSGLIRVLPVYGIFFLVVALSSMGMPATNGFIGELYVLIGAYKAHWFFAIPVVIGVLLGTVYLLWMFQRVFLGDLVIPKHDALKDLGHREIVAVAPLIIIIFWIGLYPKPFLQVTDASINNLVKMVEENSHRSLANDRKHGITDPRLSRVPDVRIQNLNLRYSAKFKLDRASRLRQSSQRLRRPGAIPPIQN
ncbi:NADH-ubiquinone oxidoreductase chain M (EC [Olavius sp. associated proteobacterium Delta 1]|nr:NADH-ubiquinone oxidoreductase chain M (EC [Olavius sp. associated proteobacterium Delta 1]